MTLQVTLDVPLPTDQLPSASSPATCVSGHPDLPAGGHEEDTMAITERERIRQSTHRHAAPNAESVRLWRVSAASRADQPVRRASSSGWAVG